MTALLDIGLMRPASRSSHGPSYDDSRIDLRQSMPKAV